MLYLAILVFFGLVIYYTLKGELQFVKDNLEIQLRQARFRIDRLERRVEELENSPSPAQPSGSE